MRRSTQAFLEKKKKKKWQFIKATRSSNFPHFAVLLNEALRKHFSISRLVSCSILASTHPFLPLPSVPPLAYRSRELHQSGGVGINAEICKCQLLLEPTRNSSARVSAALRAGPWELRSTGAGLPVARNSQGCLESFQVVCFRGFAPSEAHVFQKWMPKITKKRKGEEKGRIIQNIRVNQDKA